MPATATPMKSAESLRSWLSGKGDAVKAAGTLPDLDDGGKPATQGERSAENKADVNKLMPHVGVEAAPKNPEHGSTDKPIADSGLMQTTVGKMPEVERAVKVVTEENEKVSASNLSNDIELANAIASLEKAASAMGIMSTAAAGTRPPAPTPVGTPSTQTPAPTTPKAAAANPPVNQAAADQQALIASYIKFANDRADLLGQFLRGQVQSYEQLTKWAEDGSLDAAMAAGAPPEDPAAAGAGAGGDPAMADPAAAAAAAPPPGAGGDPAAGGAGGGGSPSPDELAAALAEMGVTPDVLMAAAEKLQQMVAGPAGAAAPAADKMAAEQQVAEMVKLASETQSHMRTGHFRLKPAADGSNDRKRRDAAKGYIDEMLKYARK